MADANVPIKFEIYKGDQLVREEVLAQSPIKIGKLASSDLRLDDETVSRMHGVIEATGPGDVHVVDLGSTRGTTVNGERVTKARLQSGDEVMFGDCRVIVTFGDAALGAGDSGAAVVGRRPSGRARADGLRAPAAAAVRASAPAVVCRPAPAVVRGPVLLGRAGRRRRGRGPRRHARDGGSNHLQRRRHRDPPPVQPGREEHAQPGHLDGVRRSRRRRRGARHVRRHGDGRRCREGSLRAVAGGRQGVEELPLEGSLPGQRRHRVRRHARRRRPVVHGPQAPRQDQPELPGRFRRRRRRAGVVGVRAVVVAPAGRRDRR